MPSKMSDECAPAHLPITNKASPEKLELQPTKPLGTQRDLALAYSPGVAAASEAIHSDPSLAMNSPPEPIRSGCLQWLGCFGAWQYRPARRKARHGRQSGSV